MMMLGTFDLLIGMVLGQRFKLLALVPAIGVGIVGTVAIGVARSEDLLWIGATGAVLSVALHMGYLVGLAILAPMTAIRGARIFGSRGVPPVAKGPTLAVAEATNAPRKTTRLRALEPMVD
jgi:hypothetical protein